MSVSEKKSKFNNQKPKESNIKVAVKNHSSKSSSNPKQVKKANSVENDQDLPKTAMGLIEKELRIKIQELEIQLKSKEAEAQDWQEKAMRFAADLNNVQRQHDLDVASGKKKTKKYVAQTVLPFLDSLNLAFSYIPETDDEKVEKFMTALKNSWQKLQNDLQSIAIELLIPKVGDKVDPQTMSAVNPNPGAENPEVAAVVSLGMKIDGDLVQASNVMIK